MRIPTPKVQPIPDDLSETYLVLDGDPLWFASKNRTYRENLTATLEALHDFLAAKGFFAAPGREFPGPAEFRISRDALTEKGFVFIWRYLDIYLDNADRAHNVSRAEYLEACLRHMETAE